MVKFAKQLEESLVPEWKDAYCNYKALKRDVKKVREDRESRRRSQNVGGAAGLTRTETFTRTVTRTMTHISTFKHNVGNQIKNSGASGRISVGHVQPDDFLEVHRIDEDCLGNPQFEQYETELLDPLQPSEADRQFFKRLDAQFNKVNKFYKMKEDQYIARGKRLDEQLMHLFNVREEHARQKKETFGTSKSNDHDSDDDDDNTDDNVDDDEADDVDGLSASFQGGNEIENLSSGHLSKTLSSVAHEELGTVNEVNEPETEKKRVTFDEAEKVGDGPEYKSESPFRSVANNGDFRSRLQQNAQAEHRLTIDKGEEGEESEEGEEGEDEEAQRSKLISIFKERKAIIQDMIDISLSKKKIVTSEKMLITAFVEFYRGLNLLKSYSSMNLVAFAKIMKKYDKAVKLRLAPVFLKEVERSYFATSNKISKVSVRVEDIFTKSFSSHDRRKAMAKLRPQRQHSGHMTTFVAGIFSGISMLLLAMFIVMLTASPAVRARGDVRYMNTVFFVFSSLGLVLLHLFLYGWNIYAWQQTRINYPFIFEQRPGTELRYRQVLCLASFFTAFVLAAMNAHLYTSTKEAPRFRVSEYIPLASVLVFLIGLFAPVNVLYASSRNFFLRCLGRLILAPLYKVILADFFLGDQLTSQIFLFRNIQFMLCYYTSGFFLDRVNGGCGTKNPFRGLKFFFSMIPYWWRFLQCLRRYYDDRDGVQLWNAGKYASALIAVAIRTRYVEVESTFWLVLFVIFSVIAMVYALYWDLVIDWGLLQRRSQNPWLRDQLILKKKYLYFISIGVNVVLRIAWLSSVQGFNFIPGLSRPGWDGGFAALEVIRRGHWNFYRLENEHLNNVGKYRAVKSVPLPFEDSGQRAFL